MHVANGIQRVKLKSVFEGFFSKLKYFKVCLCSDRRQTLQIIIPKKFLRIRHHWKHSIVSVKKIVLEVHLKQHLITEEYALCRRTLSKNTALQ